MASVTIAAGALTEVTGTASDQGIKGADSDAGSQGNLARVARKTEIAVAKAASRASEDSRGYAHHPAPVAQLDRASVF